MMPLGIDFWEVVSGFLVEKWRHVGTKIDQKSMPTSKSDFLKNRTLAAAGARFFRFGGSKLEVKTDQKMESRWEASWHRFLLDFGGFLEASWEGKWSQDRPKKASKKRWKNGRRRDGQKVATRRSKEWRPQGSRALVFPKLRKG